MHPDLPLILGAVALAVLAALVLALSLPRSPRRGKPARGEGGSTTTGPVGDSAPHPPKDRQADGDGETRGFWASLFGGDGGGSGSDGGGGGGGGDGGGGGG